MFVWMKGRRRPKSEVAKVRELIAAGLSDYEIARRTGIPRGTILAWRHDGGRASSHPVTLEDRCEACGGVHSPETLDRLAYAYLLGEYLGDGCLWRSAARGPVCCGSRATPSTEGSLRSAAARSSRSAAELRMSTGSRQAPHHDHVLLACVALSLSSARARAQTPSTDRPGRLAAGHRGGISGALPSRADRLGRVAWSQSSARQGSRLRVSALPVLEPLTGHQGLVHEYL